MCVSGDVILLGRFVFRRQGAAWIEEALITDPGGAENFGLPVAVDGEVALVGFPVWVFRFDGSNWIPEDELAQSDPEPFDFFGVVVALSGDVALVGAPLRTESFGLQGVVYVYRRKGSIWTETQKLIASDAGKEDHFGTSMDIDGDTMVVGTNQTFGCSIPEIPGCQPGAAYVFRLVDNTWVEEQKLVPSDGQGNDGFGQAVAVSGDTIVVGSKEHPAQTSERPGAAYVYHWDGAAWLERAKLVASDPVQEGWFGEAVAISGETAIIGAMWADGAEPTSGAAYVFAVAGDCNGNDQVDMCEALADPSLDVNENLILDTCENIPTVSQWGLVMLTLLLLSCASVLIHQRRRVRSCV